MSIKGGKSRRSFCTSVYLIALALSCGVIRGQFVTGTVSGRILDPSGNVVAGAPISLTSDTTGDARQTSSNEAGAFTFPAVPPGAYSIKIETQGFQTYQRTGLVVSANERVSVGDITLTLGAVSEKVTVSAEGALVQTSSAENSALITSKQIDMLLIRSRDVTSLLRLAPGVVSTSDSESVASTGYGSKAPNIQGNRQTWSIYTVDGLSGSDHGDATVFSSTVNMDAVAELKVLSNSYQAEYGRSGGALINAVTKSGTQDFHGTGYWYKRHEEFNANDFFNNANGKPKARYRYSTLGASIGGPVTIPNKFNTSKEKLFFFYSIEDWQTQTPQNLQQFTVPTALERAGNFSQSLDTNGALIVVNDPTTKRPFPNNIIPASRLNANGMAIMNVFHLPNALDRSITSGNYNYTFQESLQVPKRSHLFKIDYAPTSQDRISFRGMAWNSDQKGYNVATPSSSWDLVKTQYLYTDKGMVLNYTRVVSPTMVNELSAGIRHGVESSPVLNENELDHVTRSKVGLSTLGQFYPSDNPLNLIPQASFGGVTGAGSISIHQRFDQKGTDQVLNFSDNFTVTHQTHIMKFGFLGEVLRNNEAAAGNFSGSFSFARDVNNPYDSNYAYANAALGVFQSYTEATSRPPFQSYKKVVEWFAQDSWKVTPKLTLEYGTRFTWYTPWIQKNGIGAAFSFERYDASKSPVLYWPALDSSGKRVGRNPLTGELVPAVLIGAFVSGTGDTANGMVVASDKTYPQGWIEPQPIQVSPRVGFAYDLTGRGKTAIRGSAGLFPMARPGDWYDIIQQPPVQYNPTVYYGTLNTFLGSVGSLFPSSAKGMEKDSRTPTLYKFTLGIQHEIGFGTIVDVSYVGSLGRHLIVSRDNNVVPYGARFLAQNADTTNPGKPLPDNFFRPYPGYGSITMRENSGTSSYHALEISINRRFARGMQYGIAYTWSKSMDYTSSDGGGLAAYVPIRIWNYGKSSFDQTHNFVLNYTWDLPKASRRAPHPVVKHVFDNWQLSGLTVFASGLPSGIGYSTVDGTDITGGGDGSRVVVTGKAQLGHGDRSLNRWFDPTVFARPAFGTYGNAPKDVFRLPGINNWDISLFKRFPIRSEARSLQLRWEMYNAFNHTQFSGVDSTARFDASGNQINARFGRVISTRSPRIMQGSLRFSF